MTLKELETQLQSLTITERADAIQILTHPQLNAIDLVNVWAYADAHPEEIAITLQEQEKGVLRSVYDLRHLEV